MYTFYVEYEKENLNIVKEGLDFEEARRLYGKYAGYLYNKAGTTWQNGIGFFENEDEEDNWRFEGCDSDENGFHGGFYPEEN